MMFTGERVVEGVTPKRIEDDHLARYAFAARHVADKIVLDAACGTGYGSARLAKAGAIKVWGIDISEEAIIYAGKRYGGPGLEFMAGDVARMPLPDDSVDIIACFETIEHVGDYRAALDELCRVLRPGGALIISTPNRKVTSPGRGQGEKPDNPHHLREFDVPEFTTLLGERFREINLYGQRLIPLGMVGSCDPAWGSPVLTDIPEGYEARYVTAVCRAG